MSADIFQNVLKNSSFPTTSRYHGIEVTTLETADGKTIAYLRRRILPQPDRFTLLLEHTVVKGDRLDNVTSKYLGDPEQFWRVCDANNAIRPDELTDTVGNKIRITLPEGIPGQPNA
jgi:hypothetical protein